MYKPKSAAQWSFLLVAIVQAAISLALECYIFGLFQASLKENANRHDSTILTETCYLSIIIFGFVFQLFLVVNALQDENTIQVIVVCLLNGAFTIYTAIQIGQVRDAAETLGNFLVDAHRDLSIELNPYLIAVPCVIGVGTLVLSIIAWKLYEEFAWNIYKEISADLRLKRRFLIYQIYVALLKVDFFLFVGFEVQFLVIVSGSPSTERVLTYVSIPITILLLWLAYYSAKKEKLAGMIVTIMVFFCALGYFLFKLIRMYDSGEERKKQYKPAKKSLTLFAAVTIVMLLATVVVAAWCTHNFGKGLKPHLESGRGHRGRTRRAAKRVHSGSDAGFAAAASPGAAAHQDKLYLDNMPPGGPSGYGPGAPYGAGSRMTID